MDDYKGIFFLAEQSSCIHKVTALVIVCIRATQTHAIQKSLGAIWQLRAAGRGRTILIKDVGPDRLTTNR